MRSETGSGLVAALAAVAIVAGLVLGLAPMLRQRGGGSAAAPTPTTAVSAARGAVQAINSAQQSPTPASP